MIIDVEHENARRRPRSLAWKNALEWNDRTKWTFNIGEAEKESIDRGRVSSYDISTLYRVWKIIDLHATHCAPRTGISRCPTMESHKTADRCRISPQRAGRGQRLQRVRGEGATRRVYATAIARALIDGLGLHLRLSQIPWLAGGRWALDALRGGIAVQRTAARAAEIARAPG